MRSRVVATYVANSEYCVHVYDDYGKCVHKSHVSIINIDGITSRGIDDDLNMDLLFDECGDVVDITHRSE